MSRKIEIVLYIMVCVVCLGVFILIYPVFEHQPGSERRPTQLSGDLSQASVRESTSSHGLPDRPISPAPDISTLKEHRRTVGGNSPRTLEELDRAFEIFLISQGLPTEDLHRALSSPVQVGKKNRARGSEVEHEINPAILENFKKEYPVTGIRIGKTNEIWVRIDSRDLEKVSMDEMMAAVAKLKGDLGAPVKVVVWVGNRPVAVRTFFGEPIF